MYVRRIIVCSVCTCSVYSCRMCIVHNVYYVCTYFICHMPSVIYDSYLYKCVRVYIYIYIHIYTYMNAVFHFMIFSFANVDHIAC